MVPGMKKDVSRMTTVVRSHTTDRRETASKMFWDGWINGWM